MDSQALQQAAIAAGFDAAGLCIPELEAADRQAWLAFVDRGAHAGMDYLADTRTQRAEGAIALLPTVRSVLVVARSYHTPELDRSHPAVARYALGKDYHRVLRQDLARLLKDVRRQLPALNFRLCVDTAPLLERAYARRAGLGWIGKNGMLLSRQLGSYTLLALALLDHPFSPLPAWPEPDREQCGRCTTCLEACPTGALVAPGVLEPSRCISYWSIEHRGAFSADAPQYPRWLFGCDRCQEVCPLNREARAGSCPRLAPRAGVLELSAERIEALDDAELTRRIAGTPLRRSGLEGLRRNAAWIKNVKRDS